MARQMVGDDQDVFRVLVDYKETTLNPDRKSPTDPWSVETGKILQRSYGPYNTLGAARGRMTSVTRAYGYRDGIVGARIQRAHTTWEDIA